MRSIDASDSAGSGKKHEWEHVVDSLVDSPVDVFEANEGFKISKKGVEARKGVEASKGCCAPGHSRLVNKGYGYKGT